MALPALAVVGALAVTLGVGCASRPMVRTPVYRLHDEASGDFRFTTSTAERDQATGAGYRDQSTPVPFYVSLEARRGLVPVRRLVSSDRRRHYMTADGAEYQELLRRGEWVADGDLGFVRASAGADTVEVWMLYNKKDGGHLFTTSAPERDLLLAQPDVWERQTSLGWAWSTGSAAPAAAR